jgi:hypothetical protein
MVPAGFSTAVPAQVPPHPQCPYPECPATGRSYDGDVNVASSPAIQEPLYACANVVGVTGVIPGADVEVFVNSTFVGNAICDSATAANTCVGVLSEPLEPGDVVEARQLIDGGYSSFASAVARDPIEDFPSGVLPTPVLDPVPLFACGEALAATNIPGATVTFDRAPGPGGTSFDDSFESPWATTVVWTTPHHLGDQVAVRQSLCAGEAGGYLYESLESPSEPVVSGPAGPLPPPVLLATTVTDDHVHIQYTNAPFGATVEISVNESPTVQAVSSARYGDPQTVRYTTGVFSPPGPTDELTLAQRLCGALGDTSVPVPVGSCDDLPPAQMQPPQVGDAAIEVRTSHPGARIQVFADGVEIGDGVGSIIALTRPLELDEEVAVVQSVGECTSQWAHTLAVGCKGIRRVPLLGETGHYGVGSFDYELPGGPVDLGNGVMARVRATVRYPTVPLGDGYAADPSPRGEPFPLFVFMHGNIDNVIPPGGEYANSCRSQSDLPSLVSMGYTVVDDHHLGYVHVLEALAREGYVAVSVDAWELNCESDSYSYEGAQLFVEHVAWWATLADGTATYDPFGGGFEGRIDLAHTTLAGHSRSAGRASDAVETLESGAVVPGVTIESLVMVAPVDVDGGAPEAMPEVPILVVRGSREHEPSSVGFYDDAMGPVRSMLYVHGATHNGFSTLWPTYAETQPQPVSYLSGPYLSPNSQVPMLREWIRRWVRWHHSGDTIDGRSVFTGDGEVSGLANQHVFQSYSESSDLLVDDFENNVSSTGLFSVPVTLQNFDVIYEGLLSGTSAPDPSLHHFVEGLYTFDGLDTGASIVHDLASGTWPTWNVSGFTHLAFRVASVGAAPILRLRVAIDGSGSAGVSTEEVAVIPQQPNQYPATLDSVMRTVRIPLSCLADRNPEVDLADVSSVRIEHVFRGPFVVDDLAFQR